MSKKVDWDFSLELSGITPDDLTMSRLADYMQVWAALLGKDSRPVFRGVVKGCALLRAQVPSLERSSTVARVKNAANDGDGAKFLAQIEGMIALDGIKRARVLDRSGAVLSLVLPSSRPKMEDVIVYDVADIDGRVVRVEGRDKTAHIGLIESGTGRAISVQTTSDALAQSLARHFRGGWLRLHTEGTWIRYADGRWEPKSLTALSFDELDDTPASQILEDLAHMPGNGWAKMSREDALLQWRKLRGIEDEPKVTEIGR